MLQHRRERRSSLLRDFTREPRGQSRFNHRHRSHQIRSPATKHWMASYEGTRRLLFRLLGGGGITAVGATAYYHRPHPDKSGIGQTPRPPWSSPGQLIDDADAPEPFLMGVARFFAIAAVASISRFYLLTLNNMRVKHDEQHAHLLRLVKEREPERSIITVSNHASTLDDPTLFAVMMPWEVNLTPSKVRWAACSQEICFKNDTLATFFGAGKVMPIERGGGIDQKLLLDVGRRIAAGQWVHIFPEGKVYQTGELGGRDPEKAKRLGGGRFKWGVGKLIARAPKAPIVIPVYHTGMQNFTPIDQSTRLLKSWVPRRGHSMGLVVGDPIEFDDLIEKYTKRKKLLLKDKQCRSQALYPDDPAMTIQAERWITGDSKEEKHLYSEITRRIESSLKALEQKAYAHHWIIHQEEPPTIPTIFLPSSPSSLSSSDKKER